MALCISAYFHARHKPSQSHLPCSSQPRNFRRDPQTVKLLTVGFQPPVTSYRIGPSTLFSPEPSLEFPQSLCFAWCEWGRGEHEESRGKTPPVVKRTDFRKYEGRNIIKAVKFKCLKNASKCTLCHCYWHFSRTFPLQRSLSCSQFVYSLLLVVIPLFSPFGSLDISFPSLPRVHSSSQNVGNPVTDV